MYGNENDMYKAKMISISPEGSKVKREKVTWVEAFKSEGKKGLCNTEYITRLAFSFFLLLLFFLRRM